MSRDRRRGRWSIDEEENEIGFAKREGSGGEEFLRVVQSPVGFPYSQRADVERLDAIVPRRLPLQELIFPLLRSHKKCVFFLSDARKINIEEKESDSTHRHNPGVDFERRKSGILC